MMFQLNVFSCSFICLPKAKSSRVINEFVLRG